jgi:hypothetical protein
MSSKQERIKINMPPELVEKINRLAGARNKKEKRFGGMNYGNVRGSLQAHVIGMTAEAAVAHHFGADVDERIFHNKGDDGRDLELPTYGVTQVKSTTYWSDPWLRAEIEHDKDYIQTYLLVYVDKEDLSCVWMIGWLPRTEVVTKPKKQLVEHGPWNYVVPEKELHPVTGDTPLADELTNKQLLLRYTKSILDKSQTTKDLFNKVLGRMK